MVRAKGELVVIGGLRKLDLRFMHNQKLKYHMKESMYEKISPLLTRRKTMEL